MLFAVANYPETTFETVILVSYKKSIRSLLCEAVVLYLALYSVFLIIWCIIAAYKQGCSVICYMNTWTTDLVSHCCVNLKRHKEFSLRV